MSRSCLVGLCVAALILIAPHGQAQMPPQDTSEFVMKDAPVLPAPPDFKLHMSHPEGPVEVIWQSIPNANVSEYMIYRYLQTDPNKTISLIAKVHQPPDSTRPHKMTYIDNATPGNIYWYFMNAKDSFGTQGPNTKVLPATVYFPKAQSR
jgi:hypothetical protein